MREVKGVLAKSVICFIVVENAIWGVVLLFEGGRYRVPRRSSPSFFSR